MGISSCQQEDDIYPPDNAQSLETIQEGMTLVGKKLENPYSVENMQKALENLIDARKNGVVNSGDIEIKTTHYYIKFKPKNEDELSVLKNDSTIFLYDYPLDHEISQGGTFYHDPEVPLGVPTYQYASLPIDKEVPQGIEYEVLEQLFIPDDFSDTVDANGRIASEEFIELLVDESLRITGNLKEKNSPNSRIHSNRWRPSGKIELFDDRLFSNVGIPGLEVRARRWFTTHWGTTDENGVFSCNGTFKRDANYSIKWEGDDFDIRSGTFGQAFYNGPKSDESWNLEIKDGDSRLYAIIFQAAHDYYYGNRLGLKSPPKNSFWKSKVKIAAFNKPDPQGEALGAHCKDCRFWGVIPRLYIWNDNRNCAELYATTIHELAHASHWELRKGDWNDTQTKVRESWARGVQWALGRIRYPDYAGGQTIKPNYTQVVVDMIDSHLDINEGVESITFDNVTGYTIKQIEDVLSKTSTWEDWEENIKTSYNNGTEDNLPTLFNYWDN